MKKVFALIILSSLLIAAQTKQYFSKNEIAQEIEKAINAKSNGIHWGIKIESLEDGDVIYEKNAEKNFLPASNMKIITTASALEILKPNYVYKTYIYKNGEISSDGILNGDLIIRGSGDPTFSYRSPNNDTSLSVFKRWAKDLKEKGIKKINGSIIGDDSCFDNDRFGRGWTKDNELDNFSAQVSGLAFDENCIVLQFTPSNKLGEKITVNSIPETSAVKIINTATTGQKGIGSRLSVDREDGGNVFIVTGSLGIDSKTQCANYTIDNPSLYFVIVLKEIIESEGISVTEQAIVENTGLYRKFETPENLLTVYESPELRTIIKMMNKDSLNFYAEQLFKTFGYYCYGRGSFETGEKAINKFLQKIDVKMNQINIADGSGLSRLNLVSPDALVKVLRHVANSDYYTDFQKSLPVSGISGTLKYRLGGKETGGKIFAKTGSIRYVSALSGYLITQNGKTIIFSILANNFTTHPYEIIKIEDKICNLLVKLR